MKNKQDVFSPAGANLEGDTISHFILLRTQVFFFLHEETAALQAARISFLVAQGTLKNHCMLPPVNPANGGTVQRSLLME